MTARHEIATPGVARDMATEFAKLVPVLRTARLELRAVRVDDFDAYASIVCTERGAYVGGPMKRDDAWYDFASLSSCWMLHGHGGWSVVDQDTGALQGFVILGLEPGDMDVELGFLFLAEAEGRGVAFEAAATVRDWAFQALRLPQLHSYIDARNVRSLALAARLGATDATPSDWAGSGQRLYLHRNPEVIQ